MGDQANYCIFVTGLMQFLSRYSNQTVVNVVFVLKCAVLVQGLVLGLCQRRHSSVILGLILRIDIHLHGPYSDGLECNW